MPPLLTIAVPTYNRAQYLDQLISKVLEQISDDARVELIISDNASPDTPLKS
jgi:glycosyltransferase involved in cell wall biosynthesis